MACCSLLSSPSLLTLQSGSSAHSTTGKLFTFFCQLTFLPCGGLFQSSTESDARDVVHRKERWCQENPLRMAQPSTESPCSSSALSDPTETSWTSTAAETDGHGGSGSSWTAPKNWHRLLVLEILWKAGTRRERRKMSSQVGLIPL